MGRETQLSPVVLVWVMGDVLGIGVGYALNVKVKREMPYMQRHNDLSKLWRKGMVCFRIIIGAVVHNLGQKIAEGKVALWR